MRQFTAEDSSPLLDLIVKEFGFSSKNKGRKLIKAKLVKVDGKLESFPSAKISKGANIQVLDEPVETKEPGKPKHLPFQILYEDDSIVAFEKPAGWITAAPDPKKRTAFTLVKNWIMENDRDVIEVFFINKLPKDASGIILVAKDAVTRVRLQSDWNRLEKRYYVLARGGFEEDGEIGSTNRHTPQEEQYVFPFRNMMQGERYAILRVEMNRESFSELFSLLDSGGTPVPGFARRGKANNPLGRLGIHFFSIVIPTEKGDQLIKTRMPKEFLNLVKFNHV